MYYLLAIPLVVELKSITHELIFKYPYIALYMYNVCIFYVAWAGGIKANILLSLSLLLTSLFVTMHFKKKSTLVTYREINCGVRRIGTK